MTVTEVTNTYILEEIESIQISTTMWVLWGRVTMVHAAGIFEELQLHKHVGAVKHTEMLRTYTQDNSEKESLTRR